MGEGAYGASRLKKGLVGLAVLKMPTSKRDGPSRLRSERYTTHYMQGSMVDPSAIRTILCEMASRNKNGFSIWGVGPATNLMREPI